MPSLKLNKPLVINNLTKNYGNSRGIKSISLNLEPGEVFGFLGPNGAGKSTTIKTILNFLAPSSGDVKIFGLDSVKFSTQIKQQIGYLAGEFTVYENLTGEQLLTYLGSFNQNFDWQNVEELAKQFDAELNKKISNLSKGNKQKLGLIQAFMHQPKLLILDEPTSGLDPIMQEEFFKLIQVAREKGTTIFFSSHNIFEVQRVANRAGFIRNGQLIAVEDINNLHKIGLHKLEVHFAKSVPEDKFKGIKNVNVIKADSNIIKFTVKGSINLLIKKLAEFDVISINFQETNLEEIFLNYYLPQENKNEN